MNQAEFSSTKKTFGQLAASIIESRKLTVAEVAKKIPNTPASQFSRWKRGQWTYIPPEKLEAVVKAITEDPAEQTDLICAYLYDLTPMFYRPTLTFTRKGEEPFSIHSGEAPWRDPLRRRIDSIADAYELDDNYAGMVDQLAAWGRRLSAERNKK